MVQGFLRQLKAGYPHLKKNPGTITGLPMITILSMLLYKYLRRSRTPQTLDPGDALAAQLLMLYYILLHEDVRLANMRNVSVTNRTPHRCYADLLSELPLKF